MLGLVTVATLAGACSKKEGKAFPNLDTWQGTARLDLESGGAVGPVMLAKRGDVVRFEAPQHPQVFGSYGGAGARHFLFDAKARTLTLVIDEAKQALDYDLAALEGLAAKAAPAPFQLAETGRTDRIAGHACDVWTGAGEGTSVEACVVKQHSSALVLGAAFLPAGASWAKPLLDGEHVPLSVIVKEGDAITFRAQLTALDETIPSVAVEVPRDFQRDNFLDALKRVRAKQAR